MTRKKKTRMSCQKKKNLASRQGERGGGGWTPGEEEFRKKIHPSRKWCTLKEKALKASDAESSTPTQSLGAKQCKRRANMMGRSLSVSLQQREPLYNRDYRQSARSRGGKNFSGRGKRHVD